MPPLRQNDLYPASSQQAMMLASRIEAKKAELENLTQLRDLSDALAMRMEALETKLSTLKDGTEAIACVLSNWQNVLQAINMASTKALSVQHPPEDGTKTSTEESRPPTLVRIPITPDDASNA